MQLYDVMRAARVSPTLYCVVMSPRIYVHGKKLMKQACVSISGMFTQVGHKSAKASIRSTISHTYVATRLWKKFWGTYFQTYFSISHNESFNSRPMLCLGNFYSWHLHAQILCILCVSGLQKKRWRTWWIVVDKLENKYILDIFAPASANFNFLHSNNQGFIWDGAKGGICSALRTFKLHKSVLLVLVNVATNS